MATFHERRLPHYYSLDQPTFLTWRLHGSLPENRTFPAPLTSGASFVAMDRLLDSARIGPRYLTHPAVARMIVEALHFRSRELGHYQLHAWAIMANHIHLLITPKVPTAKLMHSLKRFTARQGNRLLNRTGEHFWQDESFDRLVRDDIGFQRTIRYIETNPVKAGLAPSPENYLWSSASTPPATA